jgi:hypothetical protein
MCSLTQFFNRSLAPLLPLDTKSRPHRDPHPNLGSRHNLLTLVGRRYPSALSKTKQVLDTHTRQALSAHSTDLTLHVIGTDASSLPHPAQPLKWSGQVRGQHVEMNGTLQVRIHSILLH